ncbi:bifunctional 4-alpha-glucanotransferase/amylo-alpha-1,6-glucosidase, partial [Spiromyces aspiralis]
MSTLRPTTSESSAKLTVWTLTLENDGSAPKDKLFIRIKPDDKRVNAIRFCIPAGYSASSSPVLYTNYPLDGSEYQRSRFHKKSFRQDEEGSGMICEFLATRPGPYQYYVEYSEVSSANGGIRTTRASPVSYFLVDPILSQNGRWLPLDGIVMQSIGPKWLGPLSSWKQQLSQSACLGYNMLHFMPLQQRGSSNSPYSIYDQLALADELFVDMPNPPA